MKGGDFEAFLAATFSSVVRATAPGVPVYMSCPLEDGAFLNAWLGSGIKLQSILVWIKNTIVLGRKDYHYKHEPILYGWIEGAAHRWYGERNKSTIFECNKPPRNGEHPTMKPVELMEYYLGNSSKSSDKVLDLFGGSGSTLIACEKTKRKCYMMELDPHYIDVIVARWVKYTGKTDIKRNGEPMTWPIAQG
jgi:DNA modification methylase